MRLSRKILFPTLLWFVVLAILLVAGIGTSIASQNHAQERQKLTQLGEAFQAKTEWLADSAMGLAASIAGNPEIQDALIHQDKETLFALVKPSYEQAATVLPLGGLTFFTPNGDFFLSALQQSSGESRMQEQTASPVTQMALSNRRPASGIALTTRGLGVYAAIPVHQGDTFAGVAEISLRLDTLVLQDFKENFGSDLQIFLDREAIANTGGEYVASLDAPIPALAGYATTLVRPIFGDEGAYQSALEGTPHTSYTQNLRERHAIHSFPLKDINGNVIGVADIVLNRAAESRTQNQRLAFAVGTIIATVILGSLGVRHFTSRALGPLQELRDAAETVLSGDTQLSIETHPDDELGLIGRALNALSRHIHTLQGDMEKRVAERTQELEKRTLYLQSAAEVARASATLTDLDTLLNRTAALINEHFQLYHTAIFLRDATGERAVLRAAAGHNHEAILSQNISLKVGSEGAVGRVIATGKAYIVSDTASDPYYIANPSIPDVRAEIIVPLRVANRIVGALSVSSDTVDAPVVNEVHIIQILADQTAIAIENARLLEENRAALAASRRLYGEISRAEWSRLLSARLLGYESTAKGVRPISETAPTGDETVNAESILEIPLEVHGKIIGTIHAEKPPQEEWQPDEQVILQQVAQQIPLALESARLFHALQERSRRETIITQIADAMGQTLDVDLMLQNILRELGDSLGFEALEIRLGNPENLDTSLSVEG